MAKLKLGPIVDEKPVKITAELAAGTYRDLLVYAEALARETGQVVEPAQLVGPMLARFMAADRGFSKVRRLPGHSGQGPADPESASEPSSKSA